MVVAYGQRYFFSVEASSAYVPPQPGSHANMVGLYIDELVTAPNPRVGEEGEPIAPDDVEATRR
jgi:hypothetical protein